MAMRLGAPSYQGKVELSRIIIRSGVGILTASGFSPGRLTEMEATLPSGRDGILRFNVLGERGMLCSVYVRKLSIVK